MGFFQSDEFQLKGYYAYRFYKLLGRTRLPTYREFKPDLVSMADTSDQSKYYFAQDFMRRPEYLTVYPPTLTDDQFVDKLISTTGITTLTAAQLKADLRTPPYVGDRLHILRKVVESQELKDREFNEAWVVMHFFAFLQRDGAPSEYASWKQVFDRNPADWRTVSYGFVNSLEYKNRFGDPNR